MQNKLKVLQICDDVYVMTDTGNCDHNIAEMSHKRDYEHAQLFAASPDMFKCLQNVVDNDFDVSKFPLLQDTIRATLAKARLTKGQK